MAQIKSWLKKAHLEPAKKAIALQQYSMKEDTAIGDKIIRENPVKFYTADKICQLIADYNQKHYNPDRQTDRFWFGVRGLLTDSPELAGQLMNPSLRNFYQKTEPVWACNALKRAQSMAEP